MRPCQEPLDRDINPINPCGTCDSGGSVGGDINPMTGGPPAPVDAGDAGESPSPEIIPPIALRVGRCKSAGAARGGPMRCPWPIAAIAVPCKTCATWSTVGGCSSGAGGGL